MQLGGVGEHRRYGRGREEQSSGTTDQIHSKRDSIRRHSPQISLNLGRIGDGVVKSRATMEGNGWRWSCTRELIYFILTDLRSGGAGDVDHDGHGKHDDGDGSKEGLPHRGF